MSEHQDSTSACSDSETEPRTSKLKALLASKTKVVSKSNKLPFNIPGNSTVDDTLVECDLSNTPKRNFCLFCKSMQSQLPRHLIRKHSKEQRVKEFKDLPPKSSKKQLLVANIRKEGNFLLLDQKNNTGKIIPVRRPIKADKSSGKNFTTCLHCKGIYTRNNIRHHIPHCSGKENAKVSHAKIIEDTIHSRASITTREEILPQMKEDEIVRVLRDDLLIILYSNDLCLRYRSDHNMIRQYLRQCGRFLLYLRGKHKNISDFRSVLKLKNYDLIINGIEGFIELNNREHFRSGSMAKLLTSYIKDIGAIYERESIINENADKEKEISNLLKILGGSFKWCFSRR